MFGLDDRSILPIKCFVKFWPTSACARLFLVSCLVVVGKVLKWWQTILHNFEPTTVFLPLNIFQWYYFSSNISMYMINFMPYTSYYAKRWYLIMIKTINAGVCWQKKLPWILRLIVFVKYKDVRIKLNPKINRRSIFRWQFLYNKHFSFRSFQFSTIINLRKAALRTTRKVWMSGVKT